MLLDAGSKLLFIGDSITDCGRRQPVGEGPVGALGNGYVALVDAFLQSAYPSAAIRVVNMGTSGHTVRDLARRWQSDVIDLRPNWVSVMIGVNDVWRLFDRPAIIEEHVPIDEYEAKLEQLVALTRPQIQGLVLMTPFYLEPNRTEPMRAMMDSYGQVVRRLAEEYDVRCVDTQAAFDRVLRQVYPATLAWDRVHPTLTGHMVLARAFLDAVAFDWHTR